MQAILYVLILIRSPVIAASCFLGGCMHPHSPRTGGVRCRAAQLCACGAAGGLQAHSAAGWRAGCGRPAASDAAAQPAGVSIFPRDMMAELHCLGLAGLARCRIGYLCLRVGLANLTHMQLRQCATRRHHFKSPRTHSRACTHTWTRARCKTCGGCQLPQPPQGCRCPAPGR